MNNWYKSAQTQLFLPGLGLDQPSLTGFDRPNTNESEGYDDMDSELEAHTGLFWIREIAKKWGYSVDVVNFDNSIQVAVLKKGDKVLVIDDFDYLSPKNGREWVEDINEWRLSDYISLPDFNEEFWSGIGSGYTVYHGTSSERVDDIMVNGLEPRDETKGISNKGDGAGVYTSAEYDTAAYAYDVVIEINVSRMKSDGYTPHVRGEGPIEDGKIREAIAYRIGLEDYYSETDSSDGLSEGTVIFDGVIPPKYLRVIEK